MREIKHLDKKHQGARDDQQDNVDIVQNREDILIALGDGMGGHSGGRRASEIFVLTARNYFESYDYRHNPKEFFNSIIYEAENEIEHYANQSGEDPRTTATLALLLGDVVHFANLGDSRVYLFDRDGLIVRSRDHSVPEMLLQMGEIEEHEMATHPDQNKLTKSLGSNSHVVATYNSYEINREDDYFILVCSDGFWEYVEEQEMMYFLFNFELSDALNNMIEIARDRGGNVGDNISLGVITLITNKSKLEKLNEDNWTKEEEVNRDVESEKKRFLQKYFLPLLAILAIFIGVIGTLLLTDKEKGLYVDNNDSNKSKIKVAKSNDVNKSSISQIDTNETNVSTVEKNKEIKDEK